MWLSYQAENFNSFSDMLNKLPQLLLAGEKKPQNNNIQKDYKSTLTSAEYSAQVFCNPFRTCSVLYYVAQSNHQSLKSPMPPFLLPASSLDFALNWENWELHGDIPQFSFLSIQNLSTLSHFYPTRLSIFFPRLIYLYSFSNYLLQGTAHFIWIFFPVYEVLPQCLQTWNISNIGKKTKFQFDGHSWSLFTNFSNEGADAISFLQSFFKIQGSCRSPPTETPKGINNLMISKSSTITQVAIIFDPTISEIQNASIISNNFHCVKIHEFKYQNNTDNLKSESLFPTFFFF